LAVQIAVHIAGAVELAVGALLADRSAVLTRRALKIAFLPGALVERWRLVVAAPDEGQRRRDAGRSEDHGRKQPSQSRRAVFHGRSVAVAAADYENFRWAGPQLDQPIHGFSFTARIARYL
jgi:hypothetical protein